MKKGLILLYFFILPIIILVNGCSKDDISNIQLVEDSIKRNYLVGEEIEIDEIKVKVTLKNEEENIYTLTKDMFAIGKIDNTKLGEQILNIAVEYKNNKINFSTSVNFSLPIEVTNIINDIDSLPNSTALNFNHESTIIDIEKKYLSLSNIHQNYISNYDLYLEKKIYFENYKNNILNYEFLNHRHSLISSLERTYNSLNEEDYLEQSWVEINNLYEVCIDEINSNINYNKVDDIFMQCKKDIFAINNIEQLNFEDLKQDKINSLRLYRIMLNEEDYDNNSLIAINIILDKSISNISNSKNLMELNNNFNSCMTQLDNIFTINQKNEIALNELKQNKIKQINNYYIYLNINNYSENNKILLKDALNSAIVKISDGTSENQVEIIIDELIEYCESVPTRDEEYELLLNSKKKEYQNTIIALYENINLYEYSSQNKLQISNLVDTYKSKINDCIIVENIETYYNEFIKNINLIPTLDEQALLCLPEKKANAIKKIEDYIFSLNSNEYEIDNWTNILSIYNETKYEIDNNVTIETSNITLDNLVNNAIKSIDNILTIQEEYEANLNEKRASALETINSYYMSLSSDDFESGTWNLVKERINNVKNKINILNDINGISKLVSDTIKSIDLAKK